MKAARGRASSSCRTRTRSRWRTRSRTRCRSQEHPDHLPQRRSDRPYDINIVNPQNARSIIILSPENDDPDSCVIKTILALVHDPARAAKPYLIAAEIREAAQCRGRPRRRRQRGATRPRRRSALADRRPVDAPAGAERGLYRIARFRRLRNLHRRPARAGRQDLRRGDLLLRDQHPDRPVRRRRHDRAQPADGHDDRRGA